jgi:hypothetical protein
MLGILMSISVFPGFLGFNQSPSLVDITTRFGNPITIEESEDKDYQSFTFTRDAYLLTAITNKSSQVVTLEAYGVNKSVKYKGVGLMSDFKSVIKKFGEPEKYIFDDKRINIVYSDCVFTMNKIGRKNYYQVVGMSVNMQKQTKTEGN